MLSNFIESFETYIKTYFDSKDTVKECLRYVKNFNQYLNLNNFSDIKQVKYDDLINFTTSGNFGPSTTKGRRWALNVFYAFLMIYKHIDKNIAKDLPKVNVPKKEANFLTTNELILMFNHLSNESKKLNGLRNLLIFALMATLGLRRKSICELNVERTSR